METKFKVMKVETTTLPHYHSAWSGLTKFTLEKNSGKGGFILVLFFTVKD